MNARFLAATSIATSMFMTAPALAQVEDQSATAEEAASAPIYGGNAIIVTAQRRAQNLLEVPLSITSSTGDQLAAQGVREISDLQFTTPGLIPNNGSGYVQLFIRGVGNTIFVGADPSVATFIDDVPRIYGSMVNDFVNVDRVEVLKGAQGGLYGRNATGGVVRIITRQPNDEQAEASAQLLYGSHNTIQAGGYVNLPVTDGLAVSFSGQRKYHDGYVKNAFQDRTPYTAANFPTGSPIGTPQETADYFSSGVNPPKRLGEGNFWAVEGKARFETGNFDITFAADYAQKDDDSGNEYVNIDPEIARATSEFIFSTFGIDADLEPGFYDNAGGDFEGMRSIKPLAGIKDYGVSATANLALGGVDLTSITAWRKNDTDYLDEQTGVAPSILTQTVQGEKEYFYQELRAVSSGDGPLEWLAGASYLNTDVSSFSTIEYYRPLATTPAVASTGGVENWSIYGQLGYDIMDDLNLTVSGRYIKEKNSVTFSSPITGTAKISSDKFLPSATLSYRLGSGGNVYARYAKGFKAGGVNSIDPPSAFPDDYGRVFDPEEVDTYEVGLRTPFADGLGQFTAAAFYNDYKGLQTFTSGNALNPGIVFAIVNAGSARTYGAEASINYALTESLDVGLNAGYLNAKYKDFSNDDATVLNTFDFSGADMLFSPKWQLSATANLDQPLTDNVSLIGSLLVSYTDDVKFFNSSAPGVPDPIQEAFILTNAKLGVAFDDGKFTLSAFANNLFDEAYFTSGNAGGLGRQMRWGNPRIIGIEAGFDF